MSYLPEFLLGLVVIGAVICLSIPSWRTFLENHSGAAGVLLAIFAGFYVLKEYEISEQDDRLDRTRAYIERIESGAVHESRQWLDLHWIKNRGLISDLNSANYGETADRDAAKTLLEEYGRNFDETEDGNAENIQHVMRLFYFYSDLAKCVELGLCDADTACSIFAEDIGRFYVLHAAFIAKWRQVSSERNFDVIKSFLNQTCNVG